ncbi:MAG: HEAT repeat domain-containing protein [Deltaproteobacteria bacterium]|nr:HEAT repeat domain-containing protein [Deltaproteobacteria bacterium]
MKAFGLLVVGLCAWGTAGCETARREAPPIMLAGPASGAPVAEVADSGLERYQRIVRNVADCPLEGYQIVPTCAGMHELAAGIANVPADVRAEVGRSMLAHASPAVRVKAAELMHSEHRARGSGLSVENQDAIADAATRERDPGVLRAFIRVIADHGTANAKVGAVLLAAADHADKDVRLQAVYALTSQANRGLAGGSTKLAQLAEKDANAKVRTTACEYAGKLASDDLIPLYEKLTASAKDPDLYAACMEGLVRMFHDHPALDTANEKAYRLFLKRLAAAPRNETSPPWSVMSTFCYYSHGGEPTKLATWKQRAPWFDAAEVKRVMISVASDKAASWMARAAAVESMIGLGASKPELEALRRRIDPRDKSVLDKIASAIAE